MDHNAITQRASMRAAIAARIEQLQRFGHDEAHDAQLPPQFLMNKAREYLSDAIDHSREGSRKNLPCAWRKTARAAALCLAALDRLAIENDVRDHIQSTSYGNNSQ